MHKQNQEIHVYGMIIVTVIVDGGNFLHHSRTRQYAKLAV